MTATKSILTSIGFISQHPSLFGIMLARYLLFITFGILITSACTRLPNVQGKGEAFLQGVWHQDSIENTAKLQSYTEHKIKFTCDSFYVDLTTHAKVNYYEEECFNNGLWQEYAKGTYVVKNDTLALVGTYTKANYKQKVSGCYHTGQYISNFKIKHWDTGSVLLENLGDQTAVNLRLKEKITCVQKAL